MTDISPVGDTLVLQNGQRYKLTSVLVCTNSYIYEQFSSNYSISVQ